MWISDIPVSAEKEGERVCVCMCVTYTGDGIIHQMSTQAGLDSSVEWCCCYYYYYFYDYFYDYYNNKKKKKKKNKNEELEYMRTVYWKGEVGPRHVDMRTQSEDCHEWQQPVCWQEQVVCSVDLHSYLE
jgi:hypothetical protein